MRYLYLRATELAFDHPAGGGRITVIAGLPPRWQDTLRTIFPGGRWMCALSVEALVDTMQPRD
jgi:hypothetical protein